MDLEDIVNQFLIPGHKHKLVAMPLIPGHKDKLVDMPLIFGCTWKKEVRH